VNVQNASSEFARNAMRHNNSAQSHSRYLVSVSISEQIGSLIIDSSPLSGEFLKAPQQDTLNQPMTYAGA